MHLFVEGGSGLIQDVETVLEGADLFHESNRFLAGLLARAHLVAQLIAKRLELLGLGDGVAPAAVESPKITQQRSRIGTAQAQFFFD